MATMRGRATAVLLLLMTCGIRGLTPSSPPLDRQRELLLDATLAALQKRADVEPNNPEAWLRLAEFYSEKVSGALSVDSREATVAAKALLQYGPPFRVRGTLGVRGHPRSFDDITGLE